jgi:hypothetical protein
MCCVGLYFSDTLAPSHLALTSRVAGSAADSAEVIKARKYSDLNNLYEVIPIAIETLGSWGKIGDKFIKNIGVRISQITREPRACAFLKQRISIAIQRGNASSVLGTHSHLERGMLPACDC